MHNSEASFKDLKSNIFNIHKTRIQDAHAISNLIMVAAFALTLRLKLGLKYDNLKWCKRIHRWRKDRKVCSITPFSRDLLDYLLEEGCAFCFSFQFSNNSP
ncbi:MAG: hypothetical protein AAGG68_20075 [Bacteroidota bacterium]